MKCSSLTVVKSDSFRQLCSVVLLFMLSITIDWHWHYSFLLLIFDDADDEPAIFSYKKSAFHCFLFKYLFSLYVYMLHTAEFTVKHSSFNGIPHTGHLKVQLVETTYLYLDLLYLLPEYLKHLCFDIYLFFCATNYYIRMQWWKYGPEPFDRFDSQYYRGCCIGSSRRNNCQCWHSDVKTIWGRHNNTVML